jgi:hypothetical protein
MQQDMRGYAHALAISFFVSYKGASLLSMSAAWRIVPNSWVSRTYNEVIGGHGFVLRMPGSRSEK